LALNIRGSTSITKRLLIGLLFFIISICVTAVGVSAPLSEEYASIIRKEIEDVQNYVSRVDVFRGATLIFGNNFTLCLSFFVPIIGILFGFYVLYSTGVAIAAQSMPKINPYVTFIMLFIMPFTWLEFLAYSMAFTENVWLTWKIIKRNCRRELMNTCVIISLCAIMLLIAAFVETIMIRAFR
jgi:hypothetical protein